MVKKGAKKKKEIIIVFGAHTDDFVIGAGGTIAKYIEEGHNIINVIFSYGELSHFWLKENVIKKVRGKETEAASKLMGGKIVFLGLADQKIYEDYQKKDVEKKLLGLIESSKPTKIFTHSIEDPHPDHKAVYKITMDLYEKSKFKPEVYVYSVWNPVSFKTDWPTLYINITKYFSLKLKTLKLFKSQKVQVAYPLFLLIFNNLKNGFKIRTLFAEKFFRIK
jgi:N-acetylglucosamine malate deacetylase 1